MYDVVLGRLFAASRRRAVALLDLQPGDIVALPGVGTGLDLSLLPVGVSAVGVDLSPEMLARARARLPLPNATSILSRAPRSRSCRPAGVLRRDCPSPRAVGRPRRAGLPSRGGVCSSPRRARVVFDKFAPPGRVRIARRVVNLVTSRLGTDVTRPFEPMLRGSGGRVVHDEPTLCGLYRVVLLERVE